MSIPREVAFGVLAFEHFCGAVLLGVKWKLSGLKGSLHHGHAFSGTGDFVLGLLWYRFSQVVAASLSEEFRGWIVR